MAIVFTPKKCHCRLLLTLLTFVFVSHNTCMAKSSRHHDVPQLNYIEEDISIQTGQELRITCYSKSVIEWIYPRHRDSEINERLTFLTTMQINSDNENEYTNVLTVNRTNYLDTGLYQCILKNSLERINNQTSDSVYVFVNSNNEDELFVQPEQITYRIFADWTFTIPCRVTNKEASVTLGINTGELVDVDGTAVSYDPERGFNVYENHARFQGPVVCTATLNDMEETARFILFYESSAPKPQPRITSSHNEVVVGSHFTITCIVDAPLSTTMVFEWEYPGKDISNSTVTVNSESQEIKQSFRTFRRFYIELELKNSELADSGDYSCTAINYRDRTTVSTSVVVLEIGYVEINPVKNQYIIESEIGSKAKIFFTTKSNPKAEYKWYKGNQIVDDNNATYSLRRLDDQRRLIINGVTLGHEGNYTLVGTNDYVSQRNSVKLVVIDKPVVTITQDPGPSHKTSPPLYTIGQSYTFDCKATGKPLPIVTWHWQQCTEMDDCKRPFPNVNQWEQISDVTSPMHGVEGTVDRPWEKKLHVPAAMVPGWYRCVAFSSSFAENVTEDIEFKLTDVRNGLQIETTSEIAIETTPFNLTCKANKYAYRNIEWTRSLNENTTEAVPTDMIFRQQTQYSHLSVINFSNLTLADSGMYTCIVVKRRGDDNVRERKEKRYNLEVQALRPPTIEVGLTQLRIETTKLNFDLHCEASGIPTPTITWYKDGVLMENNIISRTTKGTIASTLTVQRIAMTDTGLYSCKASSDGGNVYSNATIAIWAKPTVMVSPETDYVTENDNATLRCIADGNPVPIVEWAKKVNASYALPVMKHYYMTVKKSAYGVESILNLRNIKLKDIGTYRCIASNVLALDFAEGDIKVAPKTSAGQMSAALSETQIRMFALAGGGIGLCLIIFIIIILTLRRHRKRPVYRHSDIKGVIFPTVIEDGVEIDIDEAFEKTPYDSSWEFPKEKLRIGQTIGRGAFGRVYKAAAWGIDNTSTVTTVAVKMLKEDGSESEKKALTSELKMLCHIGQHLNIVNLLGACTKDCLFIIIEFCKYGNLCDYLRTRRESFVLEPKTPTSSAQSSESYEDVFEYGEDSLSLHDLACFVFQVARGMEFLSSKKVIHRDLAARNVLLSEDNVVKICDFGLARDVYTDPNYITSSSCRLPIKWMAPESICDDKVFTTESDVWSFGVLIWEIFSLGGTPYPGLPINEEFYQKIRSGYRMRCPELAPQEIYQIMLQCWNAIPRNRPSFHQLAQKLGSHLEATVRQEYIDLNEPYEKRNSRLIGGYAELIHDSIPTEYQPLMSKSGADSDKYLEPVTRRVNGSSETTFPVGANDEECHPLTSHKSSSKSEESVSSDLSSGFHSEGYPHEPKSPNSVAEDTMDEPPDYSKVIDAETSFTT
ncbi:vascular endothelial growth factor receptor 1 [Saccoglossus kowalevskii]|uniref:receptor protein-tyrosine kinase n=2 Tax=Saccoglossus kowalevskii TaxID=10224 RepID=A0ABM0GZZ3_SACKO|nr:PREDICTED: vascular endothelial growth factor receptor 3 [Saccoglossus kowalevskii]